MDTIIAFFSIFEPAEIITSYVIIVITAFTCVTMAIKLESSTTNKRKFYILQGVLAITFIAYLIIAFTSLYISHYKFAPQNWFTGIPAQEQNMFIKYLQKHKYNAITIHQYEEIKYKYHEHQEAEQLQKSIKNKKKIQIQYEKKHVSAYREQQMKALKENT